MHTTPSTLLLPAEAVENIVCLVGIDEILDRLVSSLHAAMSAYDPRATLSPVRSGFHYDSPHPGLVEWMPVYARESEVVIKVVGYHPDNPGRYRLPTILSTISAYDSATGHLSCLMDGVLPTALRTAAASVVASRLLAAPDSRTLGIIGCGAQAVAHLHALDRYFELEEVIIYDTDAAAADGFAERCQSFSLATPIQLKPLREVVRRADILLTATSIAVGSGPLFDGVPTRPHLHVNAIGSDLPGKTELPLSLLRQSVVCPDFPAQAVLEGECQRLKPAEIGPDIVELCQQSVAYTTLQQQRTVYDSTGWSLQDQVVMRLFLTLAGELGLGQRVVLEQTGGAADNPYAFLQPAPVAAQSTRHATI